MRSFRIHGIAICVAMLGIVELAAASTSQEMAESILAKAHFTGGVVVHVHGADASLLVALHKQCPHLLGQLLVGTEDAASPAREALVAAGLHGKITVGQWPGGSLPFIDNFVNLMVVERPDAVSREEALRVLAPMGTAFFGSEMLHKPRPATMDDWTHQLYDASGNAVSKDKALKPPLEHLQWVGSPRWSRHHDKMSSVSACVSGDGKVFYIFDQGSTFTPYLPCHWTLTARDAFNGVVLWQQPIDPWIGNLYGLKSGPATLPRRLVVAGKRLCVTLGIEAPVSVLDTATGKVLQTLAGTEGAEEIIHEEGVLYLVTDTNQGKEEFQNGPRMNFPSGRWIQRKKEVICCDLEEGKVRWSKSFDWVAPSTLSASHGKVYFFDGKQVIALSREDGSQLWKSAELPVWKQMATFYAPKLTVQGGVVMFVGGEDYIPHRGSANGQVAGLSTENGKVLWTAKHLSGGYQSPEDLLVIDGKMWAANVTSGRKESPTGDGTILARDPGSGKEEKKFSDIPAYWFHHRCYPAKATEDYLIMSRTGTEFVDVRTGEWTLHHWVRGACLYGIMPANGLLYAPQHPCACYIGAKMYGFTALAPRGSSAKVFQPAAEDQRLSIARGGALAAFPKQEAQEAGEWPTYRSDIARSGLVSGIGAPSKLKWSVKLPGQLTQPVIAGQQVLVADKDNPVLCAFAADSGAPVWRFHPGGRIDSSPAVYKGLVYFGATDGFVYCLDLSSGALRWKFQAAPALANHMYLERMEATHPVHGNVLVMNDRVYTVAGRSMFTDGGIHFLVLDALTGRKLHEHIMDDKMPGTGEPLQMQHEILNMPMALSDLLSSNGKKVFMRYQPFDLDGKRLDIPFSGKRFGYEPGTMAADGAAAFDPVANKQKGEDAHLFSGTGFLDDSWWHRTYWIYGNYHASGHNGYTLAGAKGAPAGRMITFDKDLIYTWGRLQRYFKWSEEYVFHLHAMNYDYQEQWSVMLPILVRAMVATNDCLFVLGPEELMRQDEIKRRITEEEVQKLMVEQEKAIDGHSGSILLAVDKRSGKILSGHRLETAPVLDGMAGAYGHLYVASTDGSLSCFGNAGQELVPLASAKIEELNRNSAPPPPEGSQKGKGSKKKAPVINLPSKEADFASVDQVHVYQSDLGYRVASGEKPAGTALKKLESPLTGKVSLKCKLQYANEDGPNNGYLCFGDGPDEALLVKCGVRQKMKTAAIIQGSLSDNKGATVPLFTALGERYELLVTVDLIQGDVTFQCGKAKVTAKLEPPLKAITHVGYGLNNSVTDFSPVEVADMH